MFDQRRQEKGRNFDGKTVPKDNVRTGEIEVTDLIQNFLLLMKLVLEPGDKNCVPRDMIVLRFSSRRTV